MHWKDLRARICGSTPSKSVGCVDVVDIADVGDVALPTACLAPHHCNVNRQVCHCALRSLGGCAGDSAFEGAFIWEPWDLADGYESFNGGIHRQFVSHSREINVIISNTYIHHHRRQEFNYLDNYHHNDHWVFSMLEGQKTTAVRSTFRILPG